MMKHDIHQSLKGGEGIVQPKGNTRNSNKPYLDKKNYPVFIPWVDCNLIIISVKVNAAQAICIGQSIQ